MSAPTTTASSPVVAVADVTPKGWAPVDNGDAQLSVPRGWLVEVNGDSVCGHVGGIVFLGEPGELPAVMGCPGVRNWIAMFPLEAVPRAFRHLHSVLVNHVPVLMRSARFAARYAAGLNEVVTVGTRYVDVVPTLHEELTAAGPSALKVLRTLTRSPLAVVLAGGERPAVPSGWAAVSFAGVRFRVPGGWPVFRDGRWPWCGFGVSVDSVVLGRFDKASSVLAPPCPAPLQTAGAEAGNNGALVAVGRYAPLPRTPTRACLAVGGLSACITAMTGTVVDLVVRAPHRRPVYVAIGLAGDGIVARTILYSLQVA